jgi:hypothetical protein
MGRRAHKMPTEKRTHYRATGETSQALVITARSGRHRTVWGFGAHEHSNVRRRREEADEAIRAALAGREEIET